VSLQSADGAGKQNIVARSARARLGAKDTGFGAVRRKAMKLMIQLISYKRV